MVSVEGEFFERALIGREACLHENMLSKHYLAMRALITHEFEKGFELKNSTSLLYLPFHSRLRACLHGVGDPGLVGLVSFVFTLWGTQNKRNLPH